MAKKYICDRCNKSYIPAQWHPRFILSERRYKNEEQSRLEYVDLCNECYSQLEKWATSEVEDA